MQLSSLVLGNNPIAGGWQHLPVRLQQLGLDGCGLQQVPEHNARLTQLSELWLRGNPILGGWQHLPEAAHMGGLEVDEASEPSLNAYYKSLKH